MVLVRVEGRVAYTEKCTVPVVCCVTAMYGWCISVRFLTFYRRERVKLR